MSTEVIQPLPGQTVITTDHRRHDGNHHGFDAVESRADFRSLTAEIDRFGTINGDRTNHGVQVTGDRVRDVGSATALAAGHTDQLVQAAACRTDSLVQAGFGDTSDRICASTKDLAAGFGAGFTAQALAACKLGDAVAEGKLSTAVGFKDSIIANNVGFSAATVQAAAIGSAAQVLATAFANQASVQATSNYNLLTVQATENNYKVLLDAQRNANAATLQAQEIAAIAAKEAAACCCRLEIQAAANLAAITATSVAGTQRILDRLLDDKNADLRAQLVATQRLIPVTIGVGA